MRLLQLGPDSELSWNDHDEDKLPPYAILSHTWGADHHEVTFSDISRGIGQSKAGYAKILFCGHQASRDDLKHFWVDSCCIDKSNNTELSEAINSMYRWYARASKCYVYLQDVSASRKRNSEGQLLCDWEAAFQRSRWFTRGCTQIQISVQMEHCRLQLIRFLAGTLQELLAPNIVEFWSQDCNLLGTKETLRSTISTITGIPHRALSGIPLTEFTTNERFRWAAGRDTKKKEDKAYCLLGIFGVFLPPIYGEGENAFARLKHEIRQVASSLSGTNNQAGIAILPSAQENSQLQAQRRQELLASLSFDQIDSRHATIKDAQRTTCEWILKHPDYVAWKDRDKRPRNQEILWIAGKPGAGKSTIMKFALARSRKDKLQDDIILSFFFNARGDDLEKTVVGMYRSLLFQLLNKALDLQAILDDVEVSNASSIQSFTWTCGVLQNLLRIAIESLAPRRLKLFIDALDECGEQQVRNMVDFFEDLGEGIPGDGSLLYICFASRHYPTVKIRGGWRLVLEDQIGHAEDLAKYIRRHLQSGRGKLITEIQAQVQEKANGVFMWAVLVIDILNKEIRAGRMFDVKRRLQELPSKLSDLFKDLIRRDCENMRDLLLCVQWILFSRRPLRREEFYFAMVAGLQHDADSGMDWQPDPWDPEEVTEDDMNRFVLNSSKGLAELTRSKTTSTVQFIHESVRDFLLKEGGLCELWPELDGNLASVSHDKLKDCCSRYMAADILNYVPSTKALPNFSPGKVEQFRRQVAKSFPFIEYASQQVLFHADEAARDVPQKKFLDTFPLDRWIRITNLYERHEVRRHGPGATLCYLAAETNLVRLLEAIKSRNAWLRLPDQRYQIPAIAAFANGHREVLQALVGDENAALCQSVTKDPGFSKPSKVSQRQDLLLWSSSKGNWAFAQYLLTSHTEMTDFSVSSKMRHGGFERSACEIAAEHGATAVVQLLLDKGAYASASALKAASGNGHREVAQLLLDKGADEMVIALQAALANGHREVVQLLLEKGADADMYALLTASANDHRELVQQLLEKGTHAYAYAFQAALVLNNGKVVQLLLNKRADVDAPGGNHANVLQAASANGCRELVQLLLDNGADVSAQCGVYGNALHAASAKGHKEVVQLLLDNGADVNAQGGHHGNALKAAIRNRRWELVHLLSERGAVMPQSG